MDTESRIEELINNANGSAAKSSGQVFELYEERLFDEIDSIIASLPESEQEIALRIAIQKHGYICLVKRLKAEQELADSGDDWRVGLCRHYMEPDTCTLGCGELEHPSPWGNS